jgi:hypothetical protein
MAGPCRWIGRIAKGIRIAAGQTGSARASARQLEGRLRHEVGEGDIDPDTAGRMHEAIDGLEQRQRQECDEGDWRSISRIADRFDRIEGWMNAEARRSHWRGCRGRGQALPPGHGIVRLWPQAA